MKVVNAKKGFLKQIVILFISILIVSSLLYFTNKYFDGRMKRWNKMIKTPDLYDLNFDLSGSIFDEDGAKERFSVKTISSLSHSFTPYIEHEVERRLIDPLKQQTIVANSPAVIWYRNNILLVSRIWLVREKYELKKNWPANDFYDNMLYTQRFDNFFSPIDSGRIIGIQAPKQFWVGDGPIEPRLFEFKGEAYISFNVAMSVSRKRNIDSTVLWNYNRDIPLFPNIIGMISAVF